LTDLYQNVSLEATQHRSLSCNT